MSLKLTNLVGFGGGGSSPITVIADGGASQFGISSSHSYGGQSFTHPVCYIIMGFTGWLTNRTLNSCTWDGNSVAIEVQRRTLTSWASVAILTVEVPRSGTLVFNFSGDVLGSWFRLLSAKGVRTPTPFDTDSYSSTTSTITLSSLIAPSSGGLEIAAVTHIAEGSMAWTPDPEVVELYDQAGIGIGYRLGGGGGSGDIQWTSGSTVQATVGVALR